MSFTENNNPLLNPLIIYEVLRKLPRSSLLSCRLVCVEWDAEACRYLRKSLFLDFQDLCQVHKFHQLLDTSAGIRQGRGLPFAQIILRASFRLGHQLAQDFFKSHGHSIHHLTILKVGCDCGANFFQKLLFYQALNLRSLNLQIISAPIRLSPESGYQFHQQTGFLLRCLPIPSRETTPITTDTMPTTSDNSKNAPGATPTTSEMQETPGTMPTSPKTSKNSPETTPIISETSKTTPPTPQPLAETTPTPSTSSTPNLPRKFTNFPLKSLSKNILKLPTLTHLHLRHQLFVERSNFIKELLNSTPSLKSLTTDATSPEFCSGVFLPTILNSANPFAKLRRLGCGGSLSPTEAQMEELIQKHIYLEELPLTIQEDFMEPFSSSGVLRLLTFLSQDLKLLELNNRQEEFYLDYLPKMRKLERLRLVNVNLEGKWLSDGVMPNLKNLIVEGQAQEGSFMALALTPNLHSSLSRLTLRLKELGDWWDENGGIYVRRIASAFPKLRGLSLNGNDGILRGIYEHLGELEELEIHGAITDEGLTGIPIQICEMMHMEQNYGLELDRIPKLGCIGDLKQLRRLVVVAPLKCSLTEVSIFFGILGCKDLSHLELSNPLLVKLWKEETSKEEELEEGS